MIKMIVKYLCYAVAGGCILLVAHLIWGSRANPEYALHIFNNITVYTQGYIFWCAGFIGLSSVYEIKRINYALKFLIHVIAGAGIIVYGDILIGRVSPGSSNVTIFSFLGIAFLLFIQWIVEYKRAAKDIQKINKALAEQNTKEPPGVRY